MNEQGKQKKYYNTTNTRTEFFRKFFITFDKKSDDNIDIKRYNKRDERYSG
jgi:hypothetical protein